MNCAAARKLLPLAAGGDLPPREAKELGCHLERCTGCAAELDTLRGSIAALREIAARDVPAPLPSDFDRRVELAAERASARRAARGTLAGLFGRRFRLALGAAAAVVVVAAASLLMRRAPEVPDTMAPGGDSAPRETATEVRWNELRGSFGGCIEGPYRLDEWTVPASAGVIAVMHKPDPVRRPDVYVIDYCGESDQLSRLRSYPWLEQRVRLLAARAGSEKNVYVAVCLLRGSSRHDRKTLERTLIESYAPHFNTRRGA